ncbi:hypothetical protein [Phytopseudomonas punonensis]|uniref:Uncharacterized protein n=1 Tax=Phytopseudomonas punonensis TaxID=1220495 RepID=A0A1M7G7S1_9GAMM|nr:hypothetical protein [Pseudomonas punonensis]SHM12444.1 hypothetical protein SAMN05216288_3099 [Pseudomonas punonensis]
MLYHTLKYGICPDELVRVLGLAMDKHRHTLLAVPRDIRNLNAPLEKLLGAMTAKQLLNEHEVTVLRHGGERTIHLVSLCGCSSFQTGSIVLPWLPPDNVVKARDRYPNADTYFIPGDGPGAPYRALGRDELSRYLATYPNSKAI